MVSINKRTNKHQRFASTNPSLPQIQIPKVKLHPHLHQSHTSPRRPGLKETTKDEAELLHVSPVHGTNYKSHSNRLHKIDRQRAKIAPHSTKTALLE
jgi:hypothetical protein